MATRVLLIVLTGVALGGPVVTVERLDGRTLHGRLVAPPAEVVGLAIDTGQTAPVVLQWSELRRLIITAPAGPTTRPTTAPAAGLRITANDGTQLIGRLDTVTDGRLSLIWGDGRPADLPVAALRELRREPLPDDARQRLAEATAAGHTDDVVLVERDTGMLVLRGELLGLDAAQMRFRWDERTLTLPWSRVVALVRGAPVAAPPSEDALWLSVRTHGGDELRAQLLASDEHTLRLASPLLGELTLPWDEIAEIEARGGRFEPLSARSPLRYAAEPLWGRTWDYRLDRTWSGQPIRLAGQTYDRGVCQHSRSTLVYALDGALVRFVATVGILDEMAGRGAAAVRVLVDDEPRWEGEVRGDRPPQIVSVDLTGARTLTLVVDYGDDLDLSDQVAWADARLIRP